MSLLKDYMHKISVKRNILDSLLLSNGSTGNGVIGTMQYVNNQPTRDGGFLSYFRVKGY